MTNIISADMFRLSLTMGVVVLCMIALMLTIEYIRKSRFQQKRDSEYIRMDSRREYYENRIYELQKELSENERRWRDANNLIIDGQYGNISNQKNLDFVLDIPLFKGLGIRNGDLIVDKKLVFVLTPFIEVEASTYAVIQETCNEVGLNCRRGDEVYRDKDILAHIISEIIKSRVVIVNINGRNPNVFYELGICHAIGKPVIIISSIKDEIPFDVVSKNVVIYKDIEVLKKLLKNELLKMFIDDTAV